MYYYFEKEKEKAEEYKRSFPFPSSLLFLTWTLKYTFSDIHILSDFSSHFSPTSHLIHYPHQLLFYFIFLCVGKEKMRQQKSGRPLIGGPFELVDQDGQRFTEQDLKGKWSLMYFGFSNCPDICPEELDKMSEVVDMIGKSETAEIEGGGDGRDSCL